MRPQCQFLVCCQSPCIFPAPLLRPFSILIATANWPNAHKENKRDSNHSPLAHTSLVAPAFPCFQLHFSLIKIGLIRPMHPKQLPCKWPPVTSQQCKSCMQKLSMKSTNLKFKGTPTADRYCRQELQTEISGIKLRDKTDRIVVPMPHKSTILSLKKRVVLYELHHRVWLAYDGFH